MPMEIKARELIAAGWPEGERLGAILRRARELDATGLARPDLLARLEAEFPFELPAILPRPGPAPLAEAVVAETSAEAVNLASARARMAELLHVPVVSRGAIMPDVCPSGHARATIPVGGAIAVENAIIPGAHSADICCSMFATFFAPNHPVGEVMDHLHKATHFGATHTVNSRSTDAVEAIREATGGFGADVVIEAIGRPETYEQAFFARDLAGTVVLVGVPRPDMTLELPFIDVFGRGGSLKSSWYGDCLPSRDFPMLIDLFQQGRLPLDKFVSETIGLDGVEAAFHKMERGEVLRSVVVL